MNSRSYLPFCVKMGFQELRLFIDSNLKILKEGKKLNPKSPISRSDFIELCEILLSKATEPPPKPLAKAIESEWKAPPPSNKLENLKNKYLTLKNQLKKQTKNPTATKRSLSKLRRNLSFAENEYRDLLNQEESDDFENLCKWRDEQNKLEAENARIKQEYDRQVKIRNNWMQFAKRVKRDVDSFFANSLPIKQRKLSWQILPKDDHTFNSILDYYTNIGLSNPHIVYDIDRLRSIFLLKPSACYVGLDEFEGYIVMEFDYSEKVALECPIYGNAIYVIDQNWKTLSKLTKNELLFNHPKSVTRIVHTGNWLLKLVNSLK